MFIKHRSGQDLSASVPAIKELVVRGIEGLSLERVAITLFAASAARSADGLAGAGTASAFSSFLGLSVPPGSVHGLWLRLLLVAAGAAVLAAGLV